MKNNDHLATAYNYDLPAKFIADRPIPGRDESKLLVYKAQTGDVIHTSFKNLPEFLTSDHMLVLNQSKVFPCRLLGEKSTGGKAELFLLSLIHKQDQYPCMIRSTGKKKVGDHLYFGERDDQLIATIKGRGDEGDFLVSFNKGHVELLALLEKHALIPIPPYIRDGIADKFDVEDYQTVYAKEVGSVAAPTAGLHFTPQVFEKLRQKGIEKTFVTLHVGAGTFKTVSSENILDHKMHHEFFQIPDEALIKLNNKKKIISVGTTSLRVLESSFSDDEFSFNHETLGSTDIFLYPGKEVNSIAGLITNFHLPKSTLLMLVSSLIGREKTLELYEIAKKENYRFFSYGDAMLILR
jgi:S-adenosylmethionine:tRNA ribosyltransferase-isomerase